MIKTKTPQKTNTTQTNNNTKLMAHLGTVGEEVYGESMKSQNFFFFKKQKCMHVCITTTFASSSALLFGNRTCRIENKKSDRIEQVKNGRIHPVSL